MHAPNNNSLPFSVRLDTFCPMLASLVETNIIYTEQREGAKELFRLIIAARRMNATYIELFFCCGHNNNKKMGLKMCVFLCCYFTLYFVESFLGTFCVRCDKLLKLNNNNGPRNSVRLLE